MRIPSAAPPGPCDWEDNLVVVYDVAGDEFVDKLDLLVVEDLFEELFGHGLVLLYGHSLSHLL